MSERLHSSRPVQRNWRWLRSNDAHGNLRRTDNESIDWCYQASPCSKSQSKRLVNTCKSDFEYVPLFGGSAMLKPKKHVVTSSISLKHSERVDVVSPDFKGNLEVIAHSTVSLVHGPVHGAVDSPLHGTLYDPVHGLVHDQGKSRHSAVRCVSRRSARNMQGYV